MPILSNGSDLTVWEEPDNPNPSPDAILFSITETDGDVIGPVGAKSDFPFGGIDLASVDVFDGFFTITSFTHEGRTETWTTVETQVFDNQGNFIRSLSAQAAYLSAQIVSVNAGSPDDLTVTWIGANEYFGGQNTAVRPAPDHPRRRRPAARHLRQSRADRRRPGPVAVRGRGHHRRQVQRGGRRLRPVVLRRRGRAGPWHA